MEPTDFSNLEEAARAFAIERHAAQKYGSHPYVHHLTHVRKVLASYGFGGALGVAAWLHDVVEDTPTSREDIRTRFGDEVDRLVWAVTGVGKTRPERNASMYEKVQAHPLAALLKQADRIANVESSQSVPERLAMYASEHMAFSEHLRGLGDERMWERLHQLITRAVPASEIEWPSGEQFTLTWKDQRAVVVELGGALRSYQKSGVDLIEGYAEQEWCSGGRGQTLAPWPNRLRDGTYDFRGESHQVPLNEPGKHNAIHGLVRWENWKLVERAADRVTLAYVLHPIPGYRFSLRLENRYRLSDEGLSVEAVALNVGTSACPYGSGAHPYLTVGRKLDETRLRAPGRIRLPTDARGIPAGAEPVEGTAFDFREGRSLRGLKVDFAFTELSRDLQGRAWVELSELEGPRKVSLWLDSQYPYLQLFSGDTLEARYLRTALGVEPITCPANAFQSQESLVVLEPGEIYRSRWGVVAGAAPIL